MALCDDEMEIRVEHETIVLRPTLRAAFRLERRFNGFDNLLKAIAEENISAMSAVIREGSSRILVGGFWVGFTILAGRM